MTSLASAAHAESALAAVSASTHSAGHPVSVVVSLFFAALLVAMILCLSFEE